MKIKPDAPWYPYLETDNHEGYPGVTIRLKLAAMMTLGQLPVDTRPMTQDDRVWCVEDGFKLADMIIERANRDEGEPDAKV